MPYRVELSPGARKDLKKVPAEIRERIVLALYLLGETPRPPGATKLSNTKDIHRVRVGDYRVLYKIQDKILLVLVVKIGHRREVYRNR
jgi:mRNA interferase RelE/StbE